MVTVTVDAEHLAPIVVLNKNLETIPDVFRLQEQVLFIVTLSEYTKFVKSLSNTNMLVLPSNTLTKIIQNTEKGVTDKATIKDLLQLNMSFALGKELHFSQIYGRGMSNYAVYMEDAKPVTRDDIEFLYDIIEDDKKLIFQEIMDSRGYPINPNDFMSKQQEFYFKYAVVCYNSYIIRNSNWFLELN